VKVEYKCQETIMALRKWEEMVSISRTTSYRFRQRGWLKTITIAGKPYVTPAALAEFMTRAEAGEFACASTTTKKV
jgi:predicted site-specific integrase-resolvase